MKETVNKLLLFGKGAGFHVAGQHCRQLVFLGPGKSKLKGSAKSPLPFATCRVEMCSFSKKKSFFRVWGSHPDPVLAISPVAGGRQRRNAPQQKRKPPGFEPARCETPRGLAQRFSLTQSILSKGRGGWGPFSQRLEQGRASNSQTREAFWIF